MMASIGDTKIVRTRMEFWKYRWRKSASTPPDKTGVYQRTLITEKSPESTSDDVATRKHLVPGRLWAHFGKFAISG